MPDTISALVVLLVAFLPGALHTWAFEREAGNWGARAADRIIRFSGTTALYLALFAFPLHRVWISLEQWRADHRSALGTAGLLQGALPWWAWLVPLIYIGLPIAGGTVAGFSLRRWPRVARILAGRDPAPRAWDFLFSSRPAAVVRARFKDGSWFGGLFGDRSYAAGYPDAPQDLFLERTYIVLEDGKFQRTERGDLIEIGSGALIRFDDVKMLELFPLTDEEQ